MVSTYFGGYELNEVGEVYSLMFNNLFLAKINHDFSRSAGCSNMNNYHRTF